MLMHWVYVLKSSSTGNIYVGETTRLFRRWNEHRTGRGGVNTSKDDYDTLIGLYNIGNNTSFIEHKDELEHGKFDWKCWFYWGKDECKQNALLVENLITEQLMFENRESIGKVKGGKYTTQERCIDFYCKTLEDDKYLSFEERRPVCHCGYPCEVNMKKDNTKIYFNCPLTKPDRWNETGFFTGLKLESKCDFYKEFNAYRIAKEKYDANRRERCRKQSEWWVKNLPTDKDGCIKCKTEDFEPFWTPDKQFYSVCEDCFHLHYEDLKREYIDKPRNIGYIFE